MEKQSCYKRRGLMTRRKYYLLLNRYESFAKRQHDGMDEDTWKDFNKISDELSYYLIHSIEEVDRFIIWESKRAYRRSSVSISMHIRRLNATNHCRRFLLSDINQRIPICEKDFRNTYFRKKWIRRSIFI